MGYGVEGRPATHTNNTGVGGAVFSPEAEHVQE